MSLGEQTIRYFGDKGRDQLAQSIVAYLFDFSRPKFLFDDLYHFSGRHYARHETSRNMLPVVKFMLAKIIQRTMDQTAPAIMIPESITNGRFYYDRAEKHEARIREARGGFFTTYRLGEILNKLELGLLSEKNKNLSMERVEGFQKLFPHMMAISPTGMEAMLKTLMKEAGFSNYQMMRDEDFEAFWIGTAMVMNKAGFADDVAYSRNGNFETPVPFFVQYGLVPFRHGNEMDVVFPDKSLVRPADYVAMLLDHIEDVSARGFTTDLSVKMAMRMVMLEDMRVNGMEHPVWGGLDRGRMNGSLLSLGRAHNNEFNEVKDRFLSLIDERGLRPNFEDLFGLGDVDGLKQYAVQALDDRPKLHAAAHGSGEGPLASVRAKLMMSDALANQNLDDEFILQTPYQHDGDFFSRRPKIFDENHFGRAEKVEQIAVKALAGLHETPKTPLAHDVQKRGEVFIIFDRRGGETGQVYADDQGMILPDEARGVKSSFEKANFEESVKAQNIELMRRAMDNVQAWDPKAIVTTSEHIEQDAANFSESRQAFAAPGAPKMGGNAKAALTEELMQRHARLALFAPHWENRPYTAFCRLHARKIQLGLIDRPISMPRHGLIVGDIIHTAKGEKPFAEKSLMDDLRCMADLYGRMIEGDMEDYPRHVVKGLIECIAFADLYYNSDLNHAAAGKGADVLIDWQSVPMSLIKGMGSRRQEFNEIKETARQNIRAHGLNAVSYQDLADLAKIDPGYDSAKKEHDEDQRRAKARAPRRTGYRVMHGVNASRPR